MRLIATVGLSVGLLTTVFLEHTNAFWVGSGPQRIARSANPKKQHFHSTTVGLAAASDAPDEKAKEEALLKAIGALYGDEPLESPDVTQQKIQSLIDNNKVVLFMKGTKFFPQCGFSDTATKILETLKVDFEAVDVLADDSIRQGIKDFSQWPTIPQLYINKEFIGGSDIMISMYESGELKEILDE